MRAYNFFYFIWEGLKSFWRNSIMSVASIVSITVCLIITGISILFTSVISGFLKDVQAMNEIYVFVDTSFDDQQVADIESKIKSLANVDSVDFISKEEGLQQYIARYGEDSDILQGLLTDNPLPDKFVIKVKDLAKSAETVYQLKNIEGITDVRDSPEVVSKLIKIQNIVNIIGFWLVALMVLVSIFITSNTIRLAMFARRLEIMIMKDVGATNWFIRWPFIIEGIIIGLIGSLVAYLVQWYLYEKVLYNLLSELSLFSPLPFGAYAGKILTCFVGVGLAVGVFGSAISVTRYLKR